MSTEQDWFYVDGEERRGPFDFVAMRQLFNAGIVHADTQVARTGDSEWSAADLHFGESIANAPPLPATEEASNPRSDSDTGFKFRELLGDWHMLPWTALLVASYFFGHLILAAYLFDWGNPTPDTTVFAWSRVGGRLFGMGLVALLPAIGICWMHRRRSLLKEQGIRVPGWMRWGRGLYWVVLFGGGLKLASGFPETSSISRLTANYMVGAGGAPALLCVSVAGVALLAASTVASERIRRQLAADRKTARPLPLFPLIADGWSKISAVLLLTALLSPVVVAVAKWPPEKNADGKTASRLIRAIKAYEDGKGRNLAKDWSRLFEVPQGEDWWLQSVVGYGRPTPEGDVSGTAGGMLLKLLNKESEDPDFLGPPGSPPSHLNDRWGRPFRVIVDANRDGMVSVGGTPTAARAVVWSLGWNGRDDGGGWDDVVRVLK